MYVSDIVRLTDFSYCQFPGQRVLARSGVIMHAHAKTAVFGMESCSRIIMVEVETFYVFFFKILSGYPVVCIIHGGIGLSRLLEQCYLLSAP